jgi:hypothetical protein
MIVWAGLAIGAVFGALTAQRRGGGLLDMAQYAAGFGIALALFGMVVTIAIARLA